MKRTFGCSYTISTHIRRFISLDDVALKLGDGEAQSCVNDWKIARKSIFLQFFRIPDGKGECYMSESFHKTGSDILEGKGAQNITSECPGIWSNFLILAPFSHLSIPATGPFYLNEN